MSYTSQADPMQAMVNAMTPKFAVSYLRVSTRGQAERGGGADDDFFQRADETVQPVRALADAEHGVGYELARKMAGDVAAAICLDDFDAACLQFRPVEEQVLLAAVTSEGDHGRVLHQK